MCLFIDLPFWKKRKNLASDCKLPRHKVGLYSAHSFTIESCAFAPSPGILLTGDGGLGHPRTGQNCLGINDKKLANKALLYGNAICDHGVFKSAHSEGPSEFFSVKP